MTNSNDNLSLIEVLKCFDEVFERDEIEAEIRRKRAEDAGREFGEVTTKHMRGVDR